MTEYIQCESCLEQMPESEATFESVPGATLAYCDDCTEPSKEEMYL